MKKIICFFIGHKISDQTDSGYEHCARCGMHEYYDGYDSTGEFYSNIPTLMANKLWGFKSWLADFCKAYYEKCDGCGKVRMFCGKYVAGHDKCLPF